MWEKDDCGPDSTYTFRRGKKDSAALRFCFCVFMFQDSFCALPICDRSVGGVGGEGGGMKQC